MKYHYHDTSAFRKIQRYLWKRWKTEILFSNHKSPSEYSFSDNHIVLAYKENDRNKSSPTLLADLLHEAGHATILQLNSWFYLVQHFSNMPYYYTKCNSQKRFVDLIREEMFAWEEGWKIARQLKIPEKNISWKHYQKIMHRNLWSYMQRITLVKSSTV